MMLPYFESIIDGVEAKVAQVGGATPRRLYTLELARLGQRLFNLGLLAPRRLGPRGLVEPPVGNQVIEVFNNFCPVDHQFSGF